MEFDDENAMRPYVTTAQLLCDTTSGEEKKKRGPGGSVPGKSPNIERDLEEANSKLNKKYFCNDPTFDDDKFARRFRISRRIFDSVFDSVTHYDSYFTQRRNCAGKRGISSHVKITTALRILAYGLPPDALDDYLQMSETTARNCVMHFSNAVIKTLGPQYLRGPTLEDMEHVLHENSKRGLPGLLRSIDC